MTDSPQYRGSVTYVVLLSLVAALGGLLFGYDTAVVSGAIGFLQQRFELDEISKGFAASSALVGCILGAACAGTLSDRLGRRTVLLASAVLFTISAIGSALPRNLVEFNLARIIGGVGVGMASMLSPLYISEVAPARIRGRLVSVNQFAIISGMLVVYFVNAWVAGVGDEAWNVARGWRWMFGSETLPAVLFMVLLCFVPESPRWLVKQGRTDRAIRVLSRVAGPRQASEQFAEIEQAIAQEGGSLAQLLRPGLRMPLLIGVGLAVLQQVTGINIVLYYAPEIFKSTGLAARHAINDTVIVGAVNLAFTLVAIWVVDRVGRKPLLLLASAGMGISLAMLGRAFVRQDFAGKAVLFWTLAYVASFAIAMGPVVWVVMAEIFPTRIRGRAMSVATVCLWVACFCVSQFFPWMLGKLAGHTFYLYAAMCAVAFVFVALFVRETKGKSLEEIESAWRHESSGL
ncbi:MAG: sugar porter family MFS transporter [Planctomycetes bacterium]|nr:sugar porter family MFS transporter [Planctomycetota bacterium]